MVRPINEVGPGLGTNEMHRATLLAMFQMAEEGLIRFWYEIDIESLVSVDYNEYIASEDWREKAEAAKESARQRCQVCNIARSESVLDAHHRTYERLGREDPEDLIVLCRSCHDLFHKNGKLAR